MSANAPSCPSSDAAAAWAVGKRKSLLGQTGGVNPPPKLVDKTIGCGGEDRIAKLASLAKETGFDQFMNQ